MAFTVWLRRYLTEWRSIPSRTGINPIKSNKMQTIAQISWDSSDEK